MYTKNILEINNNALFTFYLSVYMDLLLMIADILEFYNICYVFVIV